MKYEMSRLGLRINIEKSEILVFGGEEQDTIGGIKVVKSIKYLGLGS